jgi:hypothetical protein
MEINVEVTKKIHLVLTPEEAIWLKERMQNPIHNSENPAEKVMRQRYWDALSSSPLRGIEHE